MKAALVMLSLLAALPAGVRALDMQHPARISHRPSTATAQWHALAGFRPVGVPGIVSTMPARASVAKATHATPLVRLATNGGEKRGPALMVARGEIPWSALSPEEREALRDYREYWDHYRPEQQLRIREGARRYLELPPARRRAVEQEHHRYRQLSPEEKRRLREEYRRRRERYHD